MMYLDPGTTRLIHDTMVREELEQHGPDHHRYVREPFPIRGPWMTLRATAARTLYALSHWISPIPAGTITTVPSASTAKA